MELKEFITESLVQIQEGVQDAINRRASLTDAAGVINPVWGTSGDDISFRDMQKVEFDVAVTATDRTAGGGKAGLRIFSAEVGADASKSVENSTVSRIKFTVPFIPPVQIVRRSHVASEE